MKLVLLALTVLVAGAAAATPRAPLADQDNTATMQHVPRAATAPCGPVQLHLVVASAAQADVVSGLLWQAGIPAGSSVDFAWPDGAGVRVPLAPDLAWAKSLIC